MTTTALLAVVAVTQTAVIAALGLAIQRQSQQIRRQGAHHRAEMDTMRDTMAAMAAEMRSKELVSRLMDAQAQAHTPGQELRVRHLRVRHLRVLSIGLIALLLSSGVALLLAGNQDGERGQVAHPGAQPVLPSVTGTTHHDPTPTARPATVRLHPTGYQPRPRPATT